MKAFGQREAVFLFLYYQINPPWGNYNTESGSLKRKVESKTPMLGGVCREKNSATDGASKIKYGKTARIFVKQKFLSGKEITGGNFLSIYSRFHFPSLRK